MYLPAILSWDFVLRFLNITMIDLALSGDNAVVIGMAAASLPRERRRLAIIIGGALAILLRISLTAVATLLMLIPLLSAVGGLALVWIAYRLLKLDLTEDKKTNQAHNFRQAILLILAADFMMSLDNVIAVAGAARGSIYLLIAGLLISMPLLMTAGNWISGLIERFKWLVYVGAFAIVFAATRMIFEDRIIESRFPHSASVELASSVGVAIVIPALFVYLHNRRRVVPSTADIDKD